MYTSFFGFTESPFNLTPDPRYLFLSHHHKEAIDHLLYGINERKGFIVITGGIGTGKTTLCRVLLNHLEASTKSALIFNSFISDMELLKSINQEFDIEMDPEARTKKDYIDALNQFLLKTFSEGGNALLLIDEAQNLSHKVLEQIRMLSNLETAKEKLIQIILVGQPELKEVLSSPSIRQLNERVMVRYHLKPLASKDIHGYVDHRMVVAGGRGNLPFTSGALRLIYRYSGGNPRRINAVCDRALLIAYAEEKHTISKGFVQKAIRDLTSDTRSEPRGMNWSWKNYASFTVLLLLLIAIAGFGGWSYREGILELAFGSKKNNTAQMARKRPEAPKPEKKTASLFLDEQKSLSVLFTLFYNSVDTVKEGHDTRNPGLVGFDLGPEYYVMLKKPFRVSLPETEEPSGFLLVSHTTEDGAVVIDSNGEERAVDRQFILKKWGRQVSWIYPPRTGEKILRRGISGPSVQELQERLKSIGYPLEITGSYDQRTFQEIMRFQENLGLEPDGIAGPRTRALLYQMVN